LIVFSVLSLPSFRASAEDRMVSVPQCPKSLTVQQHITSESAGWKPVGTDGPHFLAGVRFFANDPRSANPVLLPHEKKRIRSGVDSLDVDFFDHLRSSKSGMQDVWIECDYVATDAKLIGKLPESAKRCEIAYTSYPFPEITLRCFDAPRSPPRRSRRATSKRQS
jgi:hypothetical protein